MRHRFVSFILLSLFALPGTLHAVVRDRITSAIPAESTTPIPGNVHPWALRAQDLGSAPADTKLESLTLRFSTTAVQQAALAQLLIDQQDPASSQYHRWLTPEQFGEQFGLSANDIAKVNAWIAAQGFTVTGVSRSGTFVTFTGTVAAVERAFHTQIHALSFHGEQHIGNLTDPVVPAALAGVVSTVTGLNDFKLQARARTRTAEAPAVAHPEYTSSVSGSHYIAPGDFYSIYDVNALIGGGVTGSGITIAVMGQTDISLTDVAAFRSASGLATNAPTLKLVGTDPGTQSSDLAEAQLDVEWSGAVAPTATILYVYSKDVLNTSLPYAIDNNLAPIVSISYGDCESGFGSSGITSFNQLFQQANAQGITIVGPSGDSGATDCDYKTAIATGGLAVDFPASSPYVTGAGGSMFNEGSGNYWSTTNNSNGGSANSYIPEAVWNETASAGSSGLSAGGGGASAFNTKPSWQTGIGVPVDGSRDVPDISLNAAYIHDAYLFCSSGFCTNGFRNSSGYLDTVGGTSVSVPTLAGILALLEEKLGTRIGNANPTIYALANSGFYPTVFHDITTGNNDSPCKAGSPNCASGGSIGYNATVGYDLASGWGSVDAFNLVNDWSLVIGSGSSGSTTGSAISTTTVTSSSTSQCGVATGTTISLTATVTGSSGTPTGTVQFLVDNSAVGGPVTLVSGTATYSLSTTGLSSGSHTISATYSGSTTYASSKGTYTIDLTSSTAGDFTISPCKASVTVASGAAASPVTYTLTSVNGFTGPVSLSVSTSSNTLTSTYSFSVSPVTLTSNGTTTTALTLYAYQKSVNAAGIQPVTVATDRSPSSAAPSFVGYGFAGSGIALGCLILLIAPKRRRWAALVVALLSVAALGTFGCGSGSGTNTTVATTTTTNASPGTYTLTVTASGTNSSGTALVHNTTITLTVQ